MIGPNLFVTFDVQPTWIDENQSVESIPKIFQNQILSIDLVIESMRNPKLPSTPNTEKKSIILLNVFVNTFLLLACSSKK